MVVMVKHPQGSRHILGEKRCVCDGVVSEGGWWRRGGGGGGAAQWYENQEWN